MEKKRRKNQMTDADREKAKELVKQMTPVQKIGHFINYNRVVCIIIVIAIIVLIWVVYRVRHPGPEDILKIQLYGANSAYDETDNVFERYMDEHDIDQDKETISVEITDDLMGEQVISTRIMSGDVDLLVGDEDIMDMVTDGGGLIALEDLLPEDLIEEYGDSLYVADDPQTGEEHLYGIMFRQDSPLIAMDCYREPQIIGITYNSEHPDTAVSMMEYILSGE